MENVFIKKVKDNRIFIIILVFGIFFRFWKLQEFFTFNFDEEYQALLAWEQVKNLHPIWIGVSASNVGYYLGPGFTYLNAFLFYISKDPVILALSGSAFGIVTLCIIYFVTAKIFSKKAAIFSALIYACSTFIAYFDRRFWNPTPIAFISVMILYSLFKAKKDSRWLILSVTLMGLSLHIHLSLLAFWPVIILAIILKIFEYIKKPYSTNYNYFQPILTIFLSIIGFLFVTFPLLIFDINHNFDNLLMPLRFISKSISNFRSAGYFWPNLKLFFDTLSHMFFLKPYTNIQDEFGLGIHGTKSPAYLALIVFSLVILVWMIKISIKKRECRLLLLSMFSFIFVFLTYSTGGVEYFLLGFMALFIIGVGIFLSRMPNFVSLPLIAIYIMLNFYTLLTTQQEQFGLKARKNLIGKIMPLVGNKSYYLETRTRDKRKYHSAGGWRYLFKVYGKTPTQSHADDYFGWIYQDEISKEKPEMRVIISEYPTQINQKPIAEFNEGVYYGYIIENQ